MYPTMSSLAYLNLNVRALCKESCLKNATHFLLTTLNTHVYSAPYIHLLQIFIAKKFFSEGKQIHSYITERGFTFTIDTFLQNRLLNMYDKCGSLADTSKVFDHMIEPDVFSWNMIIAAHKSHGFLQEALALFNQMQRTGIQLNEFTFSTVLPVCANEDSIRHSLQIHGKVIRCGFQSNVVVMNTLIDIYAKFGNMHKAGQLFDKMPKRDVVSWAAVLAGYKRNGFIEKSLEVFKLMQLAGLTPNSATFASMLPVCAKLGALEQGIDIHRKIIENGLMSDVAVMTSLIDLYAKCGRIAKARQLFDNMHNADVVSWNAMITGYSQNGVPDEALKLLKEMPQSNVVSWTAIISGYAQNGLSEKALEIFKQMQFLSVNPKSTTFVSALTACGKIGSVEQGMEIHQKIIERGILWDVVVMTALIDMYAKCGRLQKAHELFDKMPQRDVASWTAVISGYAQDGLPSKALEIFKQMQLAGVKPDSLIFVSVLPACAKVGALEWGMEIHERIIESLFLCDVVVTALIDMYAKCGSIQKARELFDNMHRPDLASWNAMIAGYAMHGYIKDALRLFELMRHFQTKPDRVSLLHVLFACSHAGLVDEGCRYLNSMSDSYRIMPTIDHYICLVDLLGRAGHLEESLNFVIKMPVKPDMVVWMCLLSACRSHKDVGLGGFVGKHLFDLDPQNAAPCVLLSNLYAELGRWGDVQKVRRLMKNKGIKKTPGFSWI
ncbi:pentatricopeptide repeat-containing protein At2g13600-like [Cryptomeria japonica]|uniref:pentatricopeptide repeat-containing protein At2g13600-like n=1 Tax=Cryptomeria japonica TaxID=3369 RepID=UPI0027DA139E|nr:pentatricopeptide repeat-containing protein At2g13600-like [Cryptomeria japonica]XP_057833195.2 pentatricopeptide repeat-containing protein At2g13600-like [Cryptomeria japonica]